MVISMNTGMSESITQLGWYSCSACTRTHTHTHRHNDHSAQVLQTHKQVISSTVQEEGFQVKSNDHLEMGEFIQSVYNTNWLQLI